jgi:hypothetical protein
MTHFRIDPPRINKGDRKRRSSYCHECLERFTAQDVRCSYGPRLPRRRSLRVPRPACGSRFVPGPTACACCGTAPIAAACDMRGFTGGLASLVAGLQVQPVVFPHEHARRPSQVVAAAKAPCNRTGLRGGQSASGPRGCAGVKSRSCRCLSPGRCGNRS